MEGGRPSAAEEVLERVFGTFAGVAPPSRFGSGVNVDVHDGRLDRVDERRERRQPQDIPRRGGLGAGGER